MARRDSLMYNCYLALFCWTLIPGAATLRHSLLAFPQSRPSQTAVKVELSIFPGSNRSPVWPTAVVPNFSRLKQVSPCDPLLRSPTVRSCSTDFLARYSWQRHSEMELSALRSTHEPHPAFVNWCPTISQSTLSRGTASHFQSSSKFPPSLK